MNKAKLEKFDEEVKLAIATLQVAGSLVYKHMEIVAITSSLYDMLDISFIAQTSNFLKEITEEEYDILLNSINEISESSKEIVSEFREIIKKHKKEQEDDIHKAIQKQVQKVKPHVELIDPKE